MSLRSFWKISLVFVFAVLTGCATSRSEIRIPEPGVAIAAQPATGKTVVIRSVEDERVFEQAPSDPSIPSLGFGGADQAQADIKSRAIGRKRNAYGKALGDILLQNGQTVESVVRENLTAALLQAGYQVKTGTSDTADYIVDAHIKKFWAWMQPGFWALSLKTNIETDLNISGKSVPTNISVHVEDNRQVATESAWTEIIGKGLQEYRNQVVTKSKDMN